MTAIIIFLPFFKASSLLVFFFAVQIIVKSITRAFLLFRKLHQLLVYLYLNCCLSLKTFFFFLPFLSVSLSLSLSLTVYLSYFFKYLLKRFWLSKWTMMHENSFTVQKIVSEIWWEFKKKKKKNVSTVVIAAIFVSAPYGDWPFFLTSTVEQAKWYLSSCVAFWS